MAYKILIKHGSTDNVYDMYGTETTTGGATTFTDFTANTIADLETKLNELDAVYGHNNLKAISELEVAYAADVTE